MKVTAIVKQLKRAEQYSIFIDEKYNFSLSASGLLDSRLHVGQQINADELGKLRQKVTYDKFYNKTLNYLSIRPRSVWEIETYLKLRKCPTPLQELIVNKLSELGLLSDSMFAKSWIANRRLLKPVSKRRLIYELRAKHVSGDNIDQAIKEDESDDRQALAEIIRTKRRQPRYQDKLKLMQYLSRQGFSYDDIKKEL